MKTRTMIGKTESFRVKLRNSFKKEGPEIPEMTSSFLHPVCGYFRVLKLLGGFPVGIGVSLLGFSKWEYVR